MKKPVTSQIQNSGISKPTSANGTKKSESALEQLQKYKNFKELTDAEVDDLTWADKMTYKKKLKEFNALQEQAKKEIEKKKLKMNLKNKKSSQKLLNLLQLRRHNQKRNLLKKMLKKKKNKRKQK